MGADVRLVDDGFDIGIRKSWEEALRDVEAHGGRPYAIPAGASVHAFGGLGYVGFAEEVRAQERDLGFAFDFVVVCTVTGSTHAGMVVGFAEDGRQRKVIGIDASATPKQTKAQVLEIARNTAKLVELGRDIAADDVVLIEDYAYPIYGVPSAETKEAIRLDGAARRHDHRPGLRGEIDAGDDRPRAQGVLSKGSKVLYAHLGGAPGAQRLRLRVPQRIGLLRAQGARRPVLGIDPAIASTCARGHFRPRGRARRMRGVGNWGFTPSPSSGRRKSGHPSPCGGRRDRSCAESVRRKRDHGHEGAERGDLGNVTKSKKRGFTHSGLPRFDPWKITICSIFVRVNGSYPELLSAFVDARVHTKSSGRFVRPRCVCGTGRGLGIGF